MMFANDSKVARSGGFVKFTEYIWLLYSYLIINAAPNMSISALIILHIRLSFIQWLLITELVTTAQM